jgi:hypothetical protein
MSRWFSESAKLVTKTFDIICDLLDDDDYFACIVLGRILFLIIMVSNCVQTKLKA